MEVKKIVYLSIFILALSVFFTFYGKTIVALEKNNYYKEVNQNIDDSYKTVVLEIGEIRQELMKMQEFFIVDPNELPNVVDRYYNILEILSNRINKLDNSVLILQKACSKSEIVYNSQCEGYQESVLKLWDNYNKLLVRYNDVISEYNYRSDSDLKLFS